MTTVSSAQINRVKYQKPSKQAAFNISLRQSGKKSYVSYSFQWPMPKGSKHLTRYLRLLQERLKAVHGWHSTYWKHVTHLEQLQKSERISAKRGNKRK